MGKGFEKFTEGIAWIQIVLSPTLIGIIAGIFVGLAGSPGFGIVIGLLGLVVGIFLAIRVSRKEGASQFVSRIMATPELDEKEKVFVKDIICQVYAGEKSLQKIELVLNEFLPNHEPLNLNYASKIDDEEYVFGSETEMVTYFITSQNVNQTFYWNKTENNPDKIMVGANITDDNQLIMSLTVDGTDGTESIYLNKLKAVLQSEIAVISYIDPVFYENGKDFCTRYGSPFTSDKKL